MFENIHDLKELKAEFAKAAFAAHPDHGGSDDAMIRTMAEYRAAYARIKNRTENKTDNEKQADKEAFSADMFGEEYISIINSLLRLEGISLELCGTWLWISGNTKPHKDTLKKIGCKWSPKKGMWYWRPEEYARRGPKRNYTIDEIRLMHGSKEIKDSVHYAPVRKGSF